LLQGKLPMKYLWEHKNWFNFKYDNPVVLEQLSHLRIAQGKLLGRITSLGIKLETEAQGRNIGRRSCPYRRN
jgi:hypothetical protein